MIVEEQCAKAVYSNVKTVAKMCVKAVVSISEKEI
jgi:hypothetical protein